MDSLFWELCQTIWELPCLEEVTTLGCYDRMREAIREGGPYSLHLEGLGLSHRDEGRLCALLSYMTDTGYDSEEDALVFSFCDNLFFDTLHILEELLPDAPQTRLVAGVIRRIQVYLEAGEAMEGLQSMSLQLFRDKELDRME